MPSSLSNKLQGMVEIFCFGQVMRAGKLSKKEQEQMLPELFHGDKKTQATSHTVVLTDREGVFLDVFEDVPRKSNQKHVKMLMNPSDMAAVF